MTAYKIYTYNSGTTTYNDISNDDKSSASFDEVSINNDFTPILSGFQLKTVNDLSSTTMQDGFQVLITYNNGTEKVKYIGYIDSSRYDKNSRMYFYEVKHILDKLKGTIASPLTTTDLYTSSGTSGTLESTNVYHGDTQITWYRRLIRYLFEDNVFGDSDIIGSLVFAVDYSGLDTNSTIEWENFSLTNQCLRYLGTDLTDVEKDLTEDLTLAYDFVKEMFKILGIKFDFNYTFGNTPTIYLYSDDTAFSPQSFVASDQLSYKENIKKLSTSKGFMLKQKYLGMKYEVSDTNNDYYFSPVFYQKPYFNILDFATNSTSLDVTLQHNHQLPSSDNLMLKHLNITGTLEQEITEGEQWTYKDADEITLIDRAIEEVRYLQANLGAPLTIVSSIIQNVVGNAYTTHTITGHNLAANQYAIYVEGITGYEIFTNGNYVYEAGIGLPSTAGKYRVQDVNTITTFKQTGLYNKYYLPTTGGTAQQNTGSAGSPAYITRIYEDTVTIGGTTDVVKVLECIAGHGIVSSSGDTLFLYMIGDPQYDNNSWSETIAFPTSGEYYRQSTTLLYLFDAGEDNIDHAKMHVLPYERQQEKILVDGKSSVQTINFMDYLTIYRINPSLSGWQDLWFAQIESATAYTSRPLLMSYVNYSPWWLYYYSQNYQQITSYKNLLNDDTGTLPTTLQSKKISYNVNAQTIDVTQEGS